jgi:hypothetical protein
MTILGKKQGGHQLPTKLTKRVERISTPDLILWAENALFPIGKDLTAYGRNNDLAYLEEAFVGAEVLYAITLELKKRHTNG